MKGMHGNHPIGPGCHENSLLDQALDRYSQAAAKYYKELNALENGPPDVRELRKEKLEKIQRELNHHRMTCESMASVQAQLDKYREEGRAASQKGPGFRQRQAELRAESHHGQGLEALEAFMKADQRPPPSSRHTAHHIVPGKGRTQEAYRARVHMHIYGIRINDPDNGVWLPKTKSDKPSYAIPSSLAHREYHTNGYELYVRRKITNRSNEAAIRFELKMIARQLEQNNLPPEAGKCK